MEKLTDFEKSIVEQMLHILKTCERDEDKGIGYYQQDGKEVFFVGLCNLIRNLTINTGVIKSLYNYLLSYRWPKKPKEFDYWFPHIGSEFFEHRIKFLEYVLQLNKETEDDKAKEY